MSVIQAQVDYNDGGMLKVCTCLFVTEKIEGVRPSPYATGVPKS